MAAIMDPTKWPHLVPRQPMGLLSPVNVMWSVIAESLADTAILRKAEMSCRLH